MPWKKVEFLGYAHYASKGYRILVPLVQNDGFDFVAERDGEFVRVNVKMAGLNGKSWTISRSGRTKHHKPVDVYLAWIHQRNLFIELPGDFLDGRKTRVIPKRIIQEHTNGTIQHQPPSG